jgi:heterodisulfide reductase subunit B
MKTWLAVASRNLALAESQGIDEILTICNGCFGSLFEAKHELDHDDSLRKDANDILKDIGLQYGGKVKVRQFAEFLYRDIGLDNLMSSVKTKLEVNAGVHYGCHFLKPSKTVQIDDPERPKILDELVESIGATSIQYKDKMLCCGAGGGVRARTPEIATKMTIEKLQNLKDAGIDCIVNPCPFCHLQYDSTQKDTAYNIPVLHISQFVGLALEIETDKLGFKYHTVPVKLDVRTKP